MTLSLYSLKLTPRRPARRQFPRKQPRFRKRGCLTYNALGNITSKTGVGAYTYHATQIHTVIMVGDNPYSYAAYGNLTGSGRSPEHERTKLVTPGRTTWYLNPGVHQGAHYERTQYTSGSIEHRHTLYGGGRPIGEILSFDNVAPTQTRYFHSDIQGSLTAVTSETGAVLTRYKYDPWGKQSLIAGVNTGVDQTRQGHTGHEMLDGGLTLLNPGRTTISTIAPRHIAALTTERACIPSDCLSG